VLTGAGGAFCSGMDLAPGNASGIKTHRIVRLQELSRLIVTIHRMPKPTVAKVDGVAVGAGCNIALACDLVIASERARFSEIFVHRGLTVDGGGSWNLPRLVGLRRAKELVFLGEFVEGIAAERIGLVNRVVPLDELDAIVNDWARRLAAGPPIALRVSKALLNNSMSVTLEEALDAEAASQALCFSTEDFKEAMAAYTEKRSPEFDGL
jgi:enoyl-CoA hydratase/carnithine racemase